MTAAPELYLDYLNGPDIAALSLTDDDILAAVEGGLLAQGRGETVIEPRVHLTPDPVFRGHFNVLRGYVAPLGFAGVKVVSDYVDNYRQALPSEMGLLSLFDPRTGAPIATHIGARGTAYWNVRLLDHIFDFSEIRVHSRRAESRDAFAARLSRDLAKTVVATKDWESCVRGADIIVEASRLERPAPLLETAWIKRGALVVPYGTMSAVELSLTDIMDKIVVDDWGQCKAGPFGSLRAHVEAGKLSAATLHAELGEIVAGLKPGRERDDETNLFWHRGLSLSDIALGAAMLAKAKKLGIGQRLRYA
ncbi:MAG: ornithine cyclodeaminase family protein [Betaproteobacteria bacterium]|nr:MAG: ornithine cyclodeaminase family protein [Betaproteobacteria bacterium]